jgi:prepilin signal peptidase PulO-like enzyme (type II secretory pathway)
MLYITIFLLFLGLCLGSFVNALVWRLHEQSVESAKKKPNKKYLSDLSMSHGRSMCPNCHHVLSAADLVPLFGWLILRGKCRYCHKPIPDNPLVELFMPLLFAASYIWWPKPFNGSQEAIFVLWLILLTGLVALIVYDLRWMLLPNKIVYPLGLIALIQAVTVILSSGQIEESIFDTFLAVIFGGGIFYVLYQLSAGKWIGGGDVKLGWLLGLIVATPTRSLLFIFIAAFGGSLVTAPMLLNGRLKRNSIIPFGPFLIVGAIIVYLFGTDILNWYQNVLLSLG